MTTSYRPMFVFASGEVAGNAERYETAPEALKSASDRFQNWTMPASFHYMRTNDPVNYRYETTLDAHGTPIGAVSL
jgi:hypothetical protein